MAILIDILSAGVVDSTGAALSSGKVYVYSPGTTSKVDVYQDENLTTLHSNPIILDSAGKAEAYVNSPIRLVIETSAGSQVDDIALFGEVSSLSGDQTLGTDSSSTIQVNGRIKGDLIPKSPSIYKIGNQPNPWKEMHLDGGSSDGGAIYFDASLTKFIKPNNTGSTLDIAGFGTVDLSDVNDLSVTAGAANDVIDAYTRTTGTTVGARGVAISSDCGTFTTTSTSFVSITNLSVTITTSGRPVKLGLISGGTAVLDGIFSSNYVDAGAYTNVSERFTFKWRRSTTDIAVVNIDNVQDSLVLPANVGRSYPASSMIHLDTPAAGTYTYDLQVKVNTSSNQFTMIDCKLYAYEL